MDDTQSHLPDNLVVNHFDGREERVSLPSSETPIRIGRETDNDVVLSDPRASRYHAQVRRGEEGLEIMDVGSANGTFVGAQRIEANSWHLLPHGSVAYLGDTTLTFQPSPASAQTVAVAPVTIPPPPPPSEPADRKPTFVPWAIIAGALVILLIIIVGAILLTGRQTPAESTTTKSDAPSGLESQTPGAPPSTEEPTTEEELIPYPVVEVEEVRAEPIILGALPDPTKAFIIVRVRVENQGTGDLVVSPSQFQLVDASGTVLMEEGSNYSQDGLRKLGLADRYQDLRLGPGGSVPESLLFAGEAQLYDVFLRYQAPGMDPITLDLGEIDAERAVAVALGTPVAEESPVAVAQEADATSTAGPTPAPTRPPELPAPRTVSASSLVGTIAYPVFNGTTYDLYLGKADGSGTSFYLPSASQPQFSSDGGRIAYHSWLTEKRALITRAVPGGNEHIVAVHLEDQLPTWSPDGTTIIFLSRRRGDRASELLGVSSNGGDPQVIGHGEYPTWALDGRLAFKGWGEPQDLGIRLSPPDLSDPVELTEHDTDTAPTVSPDGKQVVFMSRRDGNWNIYIMNSDGTGMTQLTDDPSEDGLPTWSPDGKAIAFVSNRGGPWAVWAVPPGGGGKRQLFTMEGSPDGFVAGEDLDKSRGWAEERITWTETDY